MASPLCLKVVKTNLILQKIAQVAQVDGLADHPARVLIRPGSIRRLLLLWRGDAQHGRTDVPPTLALSLRWAILPSAFFGGPRSPGGASPSFASSSGAVPTRMVVRRLQAPVHLPEQVRLPQLVDPSPRAYTSSLQSSDALVPPTVSPPGGPTAAVAAAPAPQPFLEMCRNLSTSRAGGMDVGRPGPSPRGVTTRHSERQTSADW